MVSTPEAERDWLTTGEAAEILEIDRSTVQGWFDFGWLDGAVLPSGFRRISKESVEELRKRMA